MTEFVGYRAAAEYLGLTPDGLSTRIRLGTGPEPELDRELVDGTPYFVFTKEELDRWLDEKPLTYRQAAKYLGISEGTLSGYVSEGTGPEPDRVGRRVLFTKDELDRWARRRARQGKKTNRPTTEDRDMFTRKTKTPRPAQAKTPDPRAALVHELANAGQVIASACGTCGATVAKDDPEAEQTHREVGTWPYSRRVRSWRYHRACSLAQVGPELLALALDPDARPVRVTQAHYDVAQQIGAPLAYRELEKASSTDAGRGRRPFQHVPRGELEELRAAVEKRHQELTIPVPHSSGWPCAGCGRSHELVEAWGQYQGRPVCAGCSQLIQRAKIPGNRRVEEYALEAARDLIPARRQVSPFPLAREMASYRPLGAGERREPWAYVVDLPEVPLTTEERLAELAELMEARLAGVAA
ncbi:helix-turn-helix domain-containing protein [Micromonospora aurantiaca]|uniref:helix-turn-helix domain-containing protein n=1 Tax=Micromonospora aurantiaca (nom. illeg.) TaxID=47850 RepID=UPI003424F084